MNTRTNSLAAAALAAMLAACSGGGAGMVPLDHHMTSGTAKTTQAMFTIKWTSATAPASVRRKDTISPAAQSIVVLINGTTNTIANRGSSATQSIVLNAPVGTDAFVFNVYDQLNGQGHLLGSAAVTQLIVDGAANVVTAAIQAVCTATNVSYTQNSVLAWPQLSAAGPAQTLTSIVIAGVLPEALNVEPEDADGDVIISGTGGAINYSITGSATVTPVNGSQLSLKPLSGARKTTPDTLTVAAPGCPSATVGVQQSPAIYVENTSGNVWVQDWYGDDTGLMNTDVGDVLIGYDTRSGKMIAYNKTTGTVTSYGLDMSNPALLYTITAGSTATWSNYLHAVFAARPYPGSSSYTQYYTYASGAIQTYPTAVLGSTPLVAAPSFSYNSEVYAYTGSYVLDFTLPGFAFYSTTSTNPLSWLTVDDADYELYGFNSSGPDAEYWYEYDPATASTPTFSLPGYAAMAAFDTDANDLYAMVGGAIYAYSAAGVSLGIPEYAYGTPAGLVVVSSNEQ